MIGINDVAVLLCSASAASIAYQLVRGNQLGKRVGNEGKAYSIALAGKLGFLFYRVPGWRLAQAHVAMVGITIFLALVFQVFWLLLLVPLEAVGPWAFLCRQAERKRRQLDAQLPLWLTALANSLRASGALSDAVSESAKLVPAPLSDELDLLLKEVRLGANMDHALRNLKRRVATRNMNAAIATLLVARDTGGDLPAVLEETAAALREMERLDGVLRTKTAEGKSQGYLMGAMPFALCAALHWIDPTWLFQLTLSPIGYLILCFSGSLWVGAIFVARRVLAVDF